MENNFIENKEIPEEKVVTFPEENLEAMTEK